MDKHKYPNRNSKPNGNRNPKSGFVITDKNGNVVYRDSRDMDDITDAEFCSILDKYLNRGSVLIGNKSTH